MNFENTVVFEDLFEIPLRNGLTKPKAVRGSGTRMVNMGELFANGRLVNTPMERVPTTEIEFEKSKLENIYILFFLFYLLIVSVLPFGNARTRVLIEPYLIIIFVTNLKNIYKSRNYFFKKT